MDQLAGALPPQRDHARRDEHISVDLAIRSLDAVDGYERGHGGLEIAPNHVVLHAYRAGLRVEQKDRLAPFEVVGEGADFVVGVRSRRGFAGDVIRVDFGVGGLCAQHFRKSCEVVTAGFKKRAVHSYSPFLWLLIVWRTPQERHPPVGRLISRCLTFPSCTWSRDAMPMPCFTAPRIAHALIHTAIALLHNAFAVPNKTLPRQYSAISCIATTTPCFAVTMRRPALLSPCSTSQRRNRTQQCFALLRLNCTSPSYAKTVLHRAITSHAPVRTPLTVTICHRNIFSAASAASGHSSPTMRRTSSVATSANRLFKVSSSRSRISPGRSPCTFAPIPMWIVRSSVSGSAP